MLQLHLLYAEALGALGVDFVFHVHAFEGKIAEEHPKEEHSNSPNVDLVVVDLLLENLRGHVRSCSTKCVHVFVVLSTKSQVAYLDNIAIRFGFGCI